MRAIFALLFGLSILNITWIIYQGVRAMFQNRSINVRCGRSSCDFDQWGGGLIMSFLLVRVRCVQCPRIASVPDPLSPGCNRSLESLVRYRPYYDKRSPSLIGRSLLIESLPKEEETMAAALCRTPQRRQAIAAWLVLASTMACLVDVVAEPFFFGPRSCPAACRCELHITDCSNVGLVRLPTNISDTTTVLLVFLAYCTRGGLPATSLHA